MDESGNVAAGFSPQRAVLCASRAPQSSPAFTMSKNKMAARNRRANVPDVDNTIDLVQVDGLVNPSTDYRH